MKEITKYSRLAGYLEKLFDMLNADFFDSELERPVITLIPSSRSYGHYVAADIWSVKGEGKRELNIATGSLNREIEYTVGTLIHEMCHIYNNEVLGIKDCSRGGTYHNKSFGYTAAAHGLIVEKSDKYGYAHTKPGEPLIDWILEHDIRDIEINRTDISVGVGGGSRSTTRPTTRTTVKPNHNYRYECPRCHSVARSGKPLNLICGDCMSVMI